MKIIEITVSPQGETLSDQPTAERYQVSAEQALDRERT